MFSFFTFLNNMLLNMSDSSQLSLGLPLPGPGSPGAGGSRYECRNNPLGLESWWELGFCTARVEAHGKKAHENEVK